MNCPHCAWGPSREQTKKTALGYRTLRCSTCKQTFNERTGTPFNDLEYPTDIVLLGFALRKKPSSRKVDKRGTVLGDYISHTEGHSSYR